jgi:peptidoglycan/xylan/chitin deacetylase (PgdA/CDA1 family)
MRFGQGTFQILICSLMLTILPLQAGTLSVSFRYDDCSGLSDEAAELKLLELFRAHGAGITFAVVPFVRTGDGHSLEKQPLLPFPEPRAELYKPFIQDTTLEVALHGYSHQNNLSGGHPLFSEFIGVDYSEFYGLNSESQADKLSEGKQFLEKLFGTRISIFVPPWNSYDTNMLKALEKAGFSCLSAGARGASPGWSKLVYLPEVCDGPKSLRETIIEWSARGRRDAAVIVMLHASAFQAGNPLSSVSRLAELDSLLQWLGGQTGVEIMTLGQAAGRLHDTGVMRFRDYNRYRKAWHFAPRFLRPCSHELYLEQAESGRLILRGWLFTAGFYGLVLVLAAVFMRLVIRHAGAGHPRT